MLIALLSSVLAATPAATEPIALQGLVASSGDGAENLLDGNPATGWSPEGDSDGEGVLFRFYDDLAATRMTVKTCPQSAELTFELIVNGARVGGDKVAPGQERSVSLLGRSARSAFVRISSAAQPACLAEVGFYAGTNMLTVQAPRAVSGKIEASSVLAPHDAYAPWFLFDMRNDFGWAEGAPGPGVGQSFTITLDEPKEITAIDLWNGYQRSPDHFKKNARVKELTVAVDGGAGQKLAVKDSADDQKITLPTPLSGKRFTFTITAATPGSKYQDLVITELRLRDKSGPFLVRTADAQAARARTTAAITANGLAPFVDKEWYGACANTRLRLRSNGTFATYAHTDDGPDSDSTTVSDGAWSAKAAGAVELFGRKQQVVNDWQPYGGGGTTDTVHVVGGALTLERVQTPEALQALILKLRKASASDAAECANSQSVNYKGNAIAVIGPAFTDILLPQPH